MVHSNLRKAGFARIRIGAMACTAIAACAIAALCIVGYSAAWADAAENDMGLTASAALTQASEDKAPIADGDYAIRSLGTTRRVLDIADGSTKNGANVQIDSWKELDSQQWHFAYDKDAGCYTITEKKSGKALTAEAAKKGANVCIRTAKDSDTQKWIVKKRGDGYQIKSASNPDYVLEVAGKSLKSGSNVRINTVKSGKGQKFAITPLNAKAPISDADIEEGVYVLKCAASGKVVEIKDASWKSGANARQNKENDSYEQRFWIEPAGKGYYRIINVSSGFALSLESSDIMPGTNVCQRKVKTSAAQLWSISESGKGTYAIACKKGGNVLEVSSGSKANYANIRVNADHGSKAQSFKLVKSGLLADGYVTLHSLVSTKRVVDVTGAATKAGTKLQLYTGNGSRAQRYAVESQGNGRYTLRSVVSGLYLAPSSDGGVVQRKAKYLWVLDYANKGSRRGVILQNKTGDKAVSVGSGKNSVKLSMGSPSSKVNRLFLPESVAPLPNGYYTLQSGTGWRVLDIEGGSYSWGSNAQIYTSNESEAQVFYLKHKGDGYYSIKNAGSGRLLTVASKKSGANVYQAGKSDSARKLWKAELGSGASFAFANKASGNLLSVDKNKDKDCANVIARKANGKSGQSWTLIDSEKPTWETIARGRAYSRISWMGSSTNYLVAVDLSYHYVMVYWNSGGTWKLWKSMQCTNGGWNTPTPAGSFEIGGKGYSFSGGAQDYTCYYWTQFYGDYLFHSVLYYYQSGTIREGRLGMALSHGCIRLDINDAKWLQDHIPSGTRVYTFY